MAIHSYLTLSQLVGVCSSCKDVWCTLDIIRRYSNERQISCLYWLGIGFSSSGRNHLPLICIFIEFPPIVFYLSAVLFANIILILMLRKYLSYYCWLKTNVFAQLIFNTVSQSDRKIETGSHTIRQCKNVHHYHLVKRFITQNNIHVAEIGSKRS